MTKTVVIPKWIEDSLLNERLMPVVDYIPIDELKEDAKHSARAVHAKVEPALPNKASTSQSTTHSGLSKAKNSTALGTSTYTPRWKSSYACQRHSPLVCPNQDLLDELFVIKRAREVDGDQRSALSYSRTISVRYSSF